LLRATQYWSSSPHSLRCFFSLLLRSPRSTLFPYTTLFRSLVRTQENPIHVKTYEKLGANPSPYAYGEVYSALQQNVFHAADNPRSEEHTSELQSRFDLVCRLLLEKKNKKRTRSNTE